MFLLTQDLHDARRLIAYVIHRNRGVGAPTNTCFSAARAKKVAKYLQSKGAEFGTSLNYDSVFDSNLNQVFLPHFLFCIGHILYQYKKFRVALKSWFVCSILDFSSGQSHCIVVLISSP